MSKLLVDEPALQVLPTLAVKIGLNEAIVLQQIHWWLNNPNVGRLLNGRKFVRNSIAEWQQDNFPWWSEQVIKRTLANLESDGLISSTSKLNERKADRTLWYTIDYTAVEELDEPVERISSTNQKRKEARGKRPVKAEDTQPKVQLVLMEEVHLVPLPKVQDVPTESTNCTDAKVQNVPNVTIDPILDPTKSHKSSPKPATRRARRPVEGKGERKPNPPYECYEAVAKIQRGINQGQTLKDCKQLLESGFTQGDILSCGRFIQSDPYFREKLIPLNTQMIVTRIDEWKRQGRPSTWVEPSRNGNGHHKPPAVGIPEIHVDESGRY
jgi:hypothetical protein